MASKNQPKPDGWVGSGSSDKLFLNNQTGRKGVTEPMDEGQYTPDADFTNISNVCDYGTDY